MASRRVAHVVMLHGELSQTFVRDAMAELDARGWEPWVLAHELRNAEATSWPPPARVRMLTDGGRRSPLPGRVGAAVDRLRREPWTARVLDVEGPLREIAPAVVHAHLGRAALYAAPAALRLGLPFLPSFHGWDLTVMPRDSAWRKALRWLFSRVPRVHTVSAFLEQRLRELGYGGRVDVIPAGIRVERIPFREPRVDRDGLRLLFVGRAVPYKGLDVLLQALPAVRAGHPDVSLDVIGDGPELQRWQALATDLGVENITTFAGARHHAAVLAAMADADVLVAPSRDVPSGQAEGSPVVTKEALAVGLPVVTTTNGGLPETVPPELRIELVPQGDHEALSARILGLASHRAAWPRRARAGRAYAEREFAWSALAQRLEAVYEELLDGRAASTS